MMDLDDLGEPVLAFLTESRLATLTTLRADGSPHVVAVGFTYAPRERIARIISFDGAVKVANARRAGRAALCQVDGGRWLTLEGVPTVTSDPERVATAVAMYAERYRPPGDRVDRVALEITVDRIMGRA